MDKTISSLREQIDATDAVAAELYCRRMALCAELAEAKRRSSLPIVDSAREDEVVANAVNAVENVELKKYFERIIREVIATSREYQTEQMKTP